MRTRPRTWRSRAAAALVLGAWLSGCTSGDATREEAAPPQPPLMRTEGIYQVRFLPPDISTGVGTLLQVWVEPAPPQQSTRLEPLIEALRLRHLASGEDVAFSTELLPGDDVEASKIHVTPSSPLDESAWYVLFVDGLDDADFGLPLTLRPFEGHHGARFVPGLRPTLRLVEACRREDGTFTATLDFTENMRVHGEATLFDLLEVQLDGEACELRADATYPEVALPNSVGFECATNVGGTMRVVVRPGLVSPVSAAPLATYSDRVEFDETLELDALPVAPRLSSGDDCRLWHPE